MANVKRTSKTSIQVIKPDCLVATIYTGGGGETADNPAGDTYIFDEVVRDTTTISQDDNSSTTVDNEFADDPILDIVSMGKFQFAAEVADIQKDVLVNFADYTYDQSSKKLYAPAAYQKKYVKIDLVFKNGATPEGADKYMSICIPKLQLNSRLMVESMNSNLARLNLAGTASSIAVTAGGKTTKSAAYINQNFTMPVES